LCSCQRYTAGVSIAYGDSAKRLRLLLILDTILLVALVILMVPFSSLAIHEWLGFAVIPPVVLHLLLAWKWIATALTRLLAKGAWRLRVKALLNTLLFIAFVITVFSGLMTSVIALPALGIHLAYDESWLRLHNSWANSVLILAGLHLAINWNWIDGTVRRLVLRRPTVRGEAAIAAVAAETPQARL
jgi:hypothetical protein